jgi:hypothetical protein
VVAPSLYVYYGCSLFKESLSSVLDHVLSIEGLPADQLGIISSLNRRTILIPENLLQPLFTWLKETLILLEQNGKLTDLEIWPTLVKLTTTVHDNLANISASTVNKSSGPDSKSTSTSGSNLSLSSSGSPSHTAATLLANGKKVFLNKRGTCQIALKLFCRRDEFNYINPLVQYCYFFISTDTRQPVPNSSGVDALISVVAFPITHSAWEWVGMLPESEVISSSKGSKLLNGVNDMDSIPGLEDPENEERDDRSSIGEKRTRFSLSHDDGSVGRLMNSMNIESILLYDAY